MKHKLSEWIQRFLRWLFGAPFEELPSEFGDLVPPELRAFQAEVEEVEHHPLGTVSPFPDYYEQTQPIKHDRSLRREQFK
jgi:hypothetical protein